MEKHQKVSAARGLLTRLGRDTRGNMLMVMAALLIPLVALTGSAIDLGRTYAVKTRLQQACDAGVLAGRKMMLSTGLPALDPAAAAAAQSFFKSNFGQGWFSTTAVAFVPTKISDSQVNGTAQATVPNTLTSMFTSSLQTVGVTCQARFDVADADIMFVLDTTGSMACTTGGACGGGVQTYTRPDGTTGYYDTEASGSKISGLRAAVLSFYDTVAGSADPTTHIRYGFVTYSSAVNVGALLPASAMVTKWNYQTRVLQGDANNGSAQTRTYSGETAASCAARGKRVPAVGIYNSDGSADLYTASFSGGTCTVVDQPLKPLWKYGQYAVDVSGYVTSLVSGNAVTDPTKGFPTTSKWQGCIEERPTTAGTSTFDTNNLPADLDPDKLPVASIDGQGLPTSSDTRWRPMWPEIIYDRAGAAQDYIDTASNSSNPYGDNTRFVNLGSVSALSSGLVSCGKPATRLAVMSRDDVSSYVNAVDFKPHGSTYHDDGMIWGTRLISPGGLFAADTAAWPGRDAPNRYIVFMTDGDMQPSTSVYGMYGIEKYDKRVTGGNFGSDTAYHNARFVAECQAAKARNITVFVVGFGQTLNDQLKACASPGQAFYASDNATLKTAFQQIAKQVAMLRLSK